MSTTFTSQLVRAAALASAVMLAACAKEETPPVDTTATAPAAAASPNMVTFTAREFSFEGPDSIPAGLTMFHLNSAGQELHHVQLIKLEEGKTYDDFIASTKVQGPPPAWAVPYGGVNPPVPGGMAIATQVMEPGNYAVVCFVDTPDKVPHIAKGMMKPLTVTSAPNANMTEPTADVTMSLNDYSFTLSKPLAAGRQVIKVENLSAAQPHEVSLIQLAPGKTSKDLLAWGADFKGPPPGKALGGIPAVVKGKNTYFDASLEPGTYVLICFVPDVKDGKPHHQHGMIQEFKVS
jgi:hypothetical protein